MADDTDRSSEATQLEENSTAAVEGTHLDDDDAEDSAAVNEDDDETDDRRDATPLAISPMSAKEDLRACQSVTLVSDLSEVPVNYEMHRDELEHLKNQFQGSHQEALATVIAQAAQAQADQKDTTDSRPLSVSHTVTIPVDSYNWRKYGQKQVKSPEGSRSYYKCTYTECDAKKIESCDQFNYVTKIVYKGQHKHDPPNKVFSNGGKTLSNSKSLKRKPISTPELNEHRSSDSVGCAPVLVEQMDEPQQKQRLKKISSASSPGSTIKHPKKPKFVVHAAGDIEISADGYRWRKYGQKMVKGNPHPRNYYKCTCAGCPVRKHIEKAVDGASEVIITYKGVHDHDMPVPKKRQGAPSGLLIASLSSQSTQVSITEPAKTNEPALTLLSVGFEIKYC